LDFFLCLAVRVPRESNYRALQLSIIKAQRSIIRDEAMEYAQEFVVFQLSLIDQYQSTTGGTIKQEYPILHDVQWPLYLEKIVEILDAYDGPGLGPSHIQVYANWHEKYLGQFISKWGCSDDKPDIHQSVTQARAALHQPSSSLISLADCFSLFTQSESLNHVTNLLFFFLFKEKKKLFDIYLGRCMDVYTLSSKREWNS
jgi:hypothetical protein